MQSNWIFTIIFFYVLAFSIVPHNVYAQETTRIQGMVVDAQTKEPLPFVSVAFVGKDLGTTTDFDGRFSIETQWASDKIEVSYLGYLTVVKEIEIGKSQEINIELESSSVNLGDVDVVASKKRYKNKGNPAVELIRKVIENKDLNRKEHVDFLEYDKYKKIEFDLNNITEAFTSRRVFKDYQFVFDHIEDSPMNGKPTLPVFLQETLSKMYYRKTPKTEKEYISGSKIIGLEEYLNTEGIELMLSNLYQDIDLYENNLLFLTNQFVSPLSVTAPLVYKFHIIDTLAFNGVSVINLAFQPRNEQDLAFSGNIYITNDDRYALAKAEIKVSEGINLNFVNDFQLVQEFKFSNDLWLISRESLIVDFNLVKKGIGIFGKKTVHYDHYLFGKAQPDSLYSGLETLVKIEGFDDRDSVFWAQNRMVELSQQEKDIYSLVDSIKQVPSFTKALDVLLFFMEGYVDIGPVSLGPFNSFYSFNAVEGSRLRFGGKTNAKLSEKFRLEGYCLYGFADKRVKYSGNAIWSLNSQPLVSKQRHSLEVMYQFETQFPGMELQGINEDNFILSFTRGAPDKILYYNLIKLEHTRDWGSGVSTVVNFKSKQQAPGGTLAFEGEDFILHNINSSELSATLRFAPNEQFFLGENYRTQLNTKYPIFKLSYTRGLKGVLDADYAYNRVIFNAFKRFAISPVGNTYVEAEAGKIFGGSVPFPLLFIPRANQTYAYQLRSYNLMNFLEFISDQYISVFAEHHFYGFILNKIPLVKQLKLREVVTFKGLYGGISDTNNPDITAGLLNFPEDAAGHPSTFSLKSKPYMEVSVGLENIFKVFRIDLVKRLTYLDHPNVSGIGVRAQIKVDF